MVEQGLASLSSRLPPYVLLVALAVGWSGCTAKESTYPVDFARYQRIDKAVETLQAAYVKKDLKTINSIRLPVEDLDRMELEMVKDFETYTDIKTEFAIERIMIEGNTIEVYVHWNGLWKKTPLEDGIRERGHGMLRWVGVQSILLSSLEGDMPFGMATRQASANRPEPVKSEKAE
jgi:hypothetical protein